MGPEAVEIPLSLDLDEMMKRSKTSPGLGWSVGLSCRNGVLDIRIWIWAFRSRSRRRRRLSSVDDYRPSGKVWRISILTVDGRKEKASGFFRDLFLVACFVLGFGGAECSRFVDTSKGRSR